MQSADLDEWSKTLVALKHRLILNSRTLDGRSGAKAKCNPMFFRKKNKRETAIVSRRSEQYVLPCGDYREFSI